MEDAGLDWREKQQPCKGSALVDYSYLILVGDIPNGRKVHLSTFIRKRLVVQ